MKFLYAYKTADNVRHEGAIRASSKESAYATLKANGIKPIRVDEAPGFFNKLFGKGKRWIAIVFLAIVAVVSILYAHRTKVEAAGVNFEDRAQLYGDPAVIGAASERGWCATFPDIGDAWLARHAIPGAKCDCESRSPEMPAIADALMSGRKRDVEIGIGDLEEVAKMKRMVNGLKRELCAYVEAGGFIRKYMHRLDIRQRAEAGILESVRRDLQRTDDQEVWKRKNAELRAMGLPMVAAEPSEL